MSEMKATEVVNEGLKREFRIEVPLGRVLSLQKKKIELKGKKYKIPGFRPGKVPFDHLKEAFGAEALQDAISDIVQETARDFMSGQKTPPAVKPTYQVESYDEEKGLVYVLSFEVAPDMPTEITQEIPLQHAKITVEESHVDAFLKEIAENQLQDKPLETPRPVKEGDCVYVHATLFPKKSKPVEVERVSFVLDKERLLPQIHHALMGKNVDDVVELPLSFQKDHRDKRLAGKTVPSQLRITEIFTRVPRETLDEDFARDLGFETLEKLRDFARQSVNKKATNLEFLWSKRQILDFYATQYGFDVPAQMTETEYQNIWRQTYGELKISETPPEDPEEKSQRETLFQEAMGKSEDELKSFYQKIAERRVRLGFLLTKLGKALDVQVTEEELREAFQKEVLKYPGEERKVAQFYQKNPQALSHLQAPLMEDKILRALVDANPGDSIACTFEEVQEKVEKIEDA